MQHIYVYIHYMHSASATYPRLFASHSLWSRSSICVCVYVTYINEAPSRTYTWWGTISKSRKCAQFLCGCFLCWQTGVLCNIQNRACVCVPLTESRRNACGEFNIYFSMVIFCVFILMGWLLAVHTINTRGETARAK